MYMYLDPLPGWVVVESVVDVVLQRQSEVSHELSAGSDAVAVKVGVVWLLWRKLRPLRLEFGTNSLNILPLLSVDGEILLFQLLEVELMLVTTTTCMYMYMYM